MTQRIIKKPLTVAAAPCRRHRPSTFPCSLRSIFYSSYPQSNTLVADQCSRLIRVPTLPEGCDYEHWLVVMDALSGYALRDEITNGYIKILSMVLESISEEEAKKSIYSVSTK